MVQYVNVKALGCHHNWAVQYLNVLFKSAMVQYVNILFKALWFNM